jgi:hypothetical protein
MANEYPDFADVGVYDADDYDYELTDHQAVDWLMLLAEAESIAATTPPLKPWNRARARADHLAWCRRNGHSPSSVGRHFKLPSLRPSFSTPPRRSRTRCSHGARAGHRSAADSRSGSPPGSDDGPGEPAGARRHDRIGGAR